MAKKTLEEMAGEVVDAARGFVERSLRGVTEKVAKLEARVAELEARPTMAYRGTYDGGVSDYTAGDVVTWKGVMWFCLQATKDRPGESSSWKLMHKTADAGR